MVVVIVWVVVITVSSVVSRVVVPMVWETSVVAGCRHMVVVTHVAVVVDVRTMRTRTAVSSS